MGYDLKEVLPELLVFTAGVLYFALSAIAGRVRASQIAMAPTGVAAIYLFAIALLVATAKGEPFAGYVRLAALLSGFGIAKLLDRAVRASFLNECQGCLAIAVAGVGLAVCATDLVTLFVALEMVSLPVYVVLSLVAPDRRGIEASIKYFFVSVTASAFFLLGLALLYGSCGDMSFAEIAKASNASGSSVRLVGQLGGVLALIGLTAKLTVVPFYVYASDVYAGTRLAGVAMISTLPKLAGIAAAMALVGALPSESGERQPPFEEALMAVAVLSMMVGAVGTLMSVDLPRLLAYSGVAHGGYMLAGLLGQASSSWSDRSTAVGFYALAYSLGTIGFLALWEARSSDAPRRNPSDGLGRAMGFLAAIVLLLSMAGIPPTAGFWGKFRIVGALLATSTFQSMLVTLCIFLASALSIGGYLRFVDRIGESNWRDGTPGLALVFASTVVALFAWPGAVEVLLAR